MDGVVGGKGTGDIDGVDGALGVASYVTEGDVVVAGSDTGGEAAVHTSRPCAWAATGTGLSAMSMLGLFAVRHFCLPKGKCVSSNTTCRETMTRRVSMS